MTSELKPDEELTRAAADVVAWFDCHRPDLSGDRIRRLRYAISNFADNTRAAAPAAVKVKALVWKGAFAPSIIGEFSWAYENGEWLMWLRGQRCGTGFADNKEDGERAAKAAAQADYEARILAALEPAPAVDPRSDPRVVRLVEALKAMRETCMSHDEYSTEAFLQADAALAALDTPQ